MVHRVYVEKKPSEALEAKALANEIRSFLGITSLKNLRIVNRYDVENIDAGLFHRCKTTVFSEPQLDIVTSRLTDIEGCTVFAVEYCPVSLTSGRTAPLSVSKSFLRASVPW